MKTIRVSEATYRAIADLAVLEYRSTGTRNADGSWSIPIDEEVSAAIDRERLPGEDDDTTVMRLIRRHKGAAPN